MAHSNRIWPYLLFVGSGLAALIHEAVFLRQLTWAMGSSAVATALTLAAFMAGLGLGAALFGRLADRHPRPLLLFGLLELGAALSAAGLAWLLGSGREILLAPLRMIETGGVRRVTEVLVAFGLLLLPTVLMGGTLPALSRALIRDMRQFVPALGLLYGLNTLGAAGGVFIAGFYLFERVGVSNSSYLAALLQMSIGVAAILLSRGTRDGAGRRVEQAAPEPVLDGRVICLFAAGIAGFAVLGYEVVWTRLLSLFMRSFSYSFSLMLSLFLLGLFLGSVLIGLLGARVRNPLRLLGVLQVAMGVYVAASVLWLPGRLAPVENASSFVDFLARAALRASLVVLPPTILSGMALPLATRGFAAGARRVGGDVGVVYSVNTYGAIVGALAAGLLLLPALGAPISLAVLALIHAGAGALVLFAVERGTWRTWVAGLLAMTCAVPLVLGSERFVRAFLGATRDAQSIGELLFFHEGATDTVAIVRKTYGFHDPEAKSLITNGIAMSATVKPVWRYMSLEGHLPVLFAREPRSAIAVGVGTGITLNAVVSHPELESIVAVELSEGVAGGLPVFEHENGRAWEDPRVELILEDGRHWLQLTDRTFDVITLEPPPPIVAGSVHLYSIDFYRLCRKRLAPGGVAAQWLPLHAQSLESARMTARTFLGAFPHVMLWLPSVRDAVLIGSAEPLEMDSGRLLDAFDEPSTAANLRAAYLETPAAFLATLLLDRKGVENWSAGAPLISDEHPLMEFFSRQNRNMTDRDIGTLLAEPQADWDWVRGLEERPDLERSIRLENHALRQYVEAGVTGDARPGLAAAAAATGTEFLLYPFGCTTEQLRALGQIPPARLDVAAHRERCRALRATP